MNALMIGTLGFCTWLGAVACGSDAPSTTSSAGASGMVGPIGGSSGVAPASGGSGGEVSQAGAMSSAGSSGAPPSKPTSMPLISRGVPAFASGSANTAVGPSKSNDDSPQTNWFPDKLPAWIAYDLSGVPEAQRHQVLVAWYANHAGAYLLEAQYGDADQAPVDYTIEINAAAGGGAPPSDGWVNAVTVTGSQRDAREHLLDLQGGNWVRMTVTKSTNPAGAAFDLDVHSAPDGASDCWLLMGDSITNISTVYSFSDIPSLVHAAHPDRWPVVVAAAIGGTNTVIARDTIDETLKYYPGRFVVLGYGTNDYAKDFDLDTLIAKILAAGKVPAIPHMPWSETARIQTEAPQINAAIDALYLKYPQIFHGPDLWAAFKDRTDLIPVGDVHPNTAGQEVFRKQWADAMSK